MADREPDSGDLIHRVTWKQTSTAPVDGSCGQDVPTGSSPVTRGNYWAKVESYSGEVLVNANQQKPVRRARVTMRKVGPIKAGDWLIFEGRKLVVVSVHRYQERDFWLVIETIEKGQGQDGGP